MLEHVIRIHAAQSEWFKIMDDCLQNLDTAPEEVGHTCCCCG